MTEARTLVAASSVTKRFGGVTALAGLDLSLSSGAVVGIVGPNGAGKSTLLDIISGFQQPDSGEVQILGRRTSRFAPWQVARLGVARTFQDVRLSKSRSVLENIALAHDEQSGERLRELLRPWHVYTVQRSVLARTRRIVATLALEGVAQSRVEDISYGQQKLTAMGCCLARTAMVYCLDEPFAGLSNEMRRVVVSSLSRLRSEGAAVLVVEHDLDTLRECVDRLVVMAAGRIVAEDEPESALRSEKVIRVLLG